MDRYELGPIGTNCYVVRAARDAVEAIVIDPSGDAAQLRLDLARAGARCVAILITHGHWDHLVGVADLAEATGAPVHMAEDDGRTAAARRLDLAEVPALHRRDPNPLPRAPGAARTPR